MKLPPKFYVRKAGSTYNVMMLGQKGFSSSVIAKDLTYPAAKAIVDSKLAALEAAANRKSMNRKIESLKRIVAVAYKASVESSNTEWIQQSREKAKAANAELKQIGIILTLEEIKTLAGK